MEKKVKITAIFLVVFLNLFLFTAIFRSFFVTTASLNTVFENAKTYYTVSEIVKQRLEDIIPEKVKEDPLGFAVVNYGINKFVTPELVSRFAQPLLNTAVKIAEAPTSIEGNNVVLDTAKFKQNATNNLGNYDLPKGIKTATSQIINSLPQQLKIVDLEKRPNSVIGRLVKFKEKLHNLKDLLWVLGLGSIGLLIYLGYLRREKINNVVKTISGTFAVSGLATVIVAAITAIIINNVHLYPVQNTVDALVNQLMVNLLNYYMRVAAMWGISIALVAGIVYFFCLEAVQKSIAKNYKKVKTTLSK